MVSYQFLPDPMPATDGSRRLFLCQSVCMQDAADVDRAPAWFPSLVGRCVSYHCQASWLGGVARAVPAASVH